MTPIRNEVASETPAVLVVVAHPDDEYYCAASTYRLTQEVGGTVDQLVVTNGEGGYRYAMLAERIYGHALTLEAIGRDRLPAIRKKETLRAGHILGIRRHFFLDQRDVPFTHDLRTSIEQHWDRPFIEQQLDAVLAAGRYDAVITVLPTEDTHAHHKAATLLALERVARMDEAARPAVLGCAYHSSTGRTPSFTQLTGYPITRVLDSAPAFSFDRRHKFGFNAALDYAIVVHWMMAEHKSQGYFQTTYGWHDVEAIWSFAVNRPDALIKAQALFEKLRPDVGPATPQVHPLQPARRGTRTRYRIPSGRRILSYSERAASRLSY